MLRIFTCLLLLGMLQPKLSGQSYELMPSTEYIFADIQFLKPFDKSYRFTLFSRTRIEVDYKEQVSFFSGAYFSYTQKNGFGSTVLGRVNNAGAGGDWGIHYNRTTDTWSFFGLLAKDLTESKGYSWFSIFRYRPKINDQWRSYNSIELFTAMNGGDHGASLQRIRIGLEKGGYQFGFGFNWLELGNSFLFINDSYGLFIRKSFNNN